MAEQRIKHIPQTQKFIPKLAIEKSGLLCYAKFTHFICLCLFCRYVVHVSVLSVLLFKSLNSILSRAKSLKSITPHSTFHVPYTEKRPSSPISFIRLFLFYIYFVRLKYSFWRVLGFHLNHCYDMIRLSK